MFRDQRARELAVKFPMSGDTLVTASGMTPRMNVSGVIRVGRSRMRARRLKNRMPTLPQLLYELDDQD